MSVARKQYKILSNLDRTEPQRRAVLSSSAYVVELQKKQMRKGEGAKGSLRNYISKEYADHKKSLSTYLAPYPKVDLFLIGRFQEGIYLKIEDKDVHIDSTDEKAPKLKRTFQPFGLNRENMHKAQIPITNRYFSIIHKLINK